jgi:type IV pilus assembly protein PilM
MRGFHKTRTAIGIDVGARSIKAVQLHRFGGHYRTAAISAVPRPAADQELEGDEMRELRRVLKRQGFQGRDVVLAAPDTALLRGVFDLPRQVSGAPVAQIARMELARMHQVAPDSFEMVCWEPPASGSPQSTMQAIAAGCPHATANAFLDQFEEHGFNVCALDIRSAAAARACAPLILAPPAITAILDVGWSATKLLLVCGGSIIYERLLMDQCLSKLIARLSERFDLAVNAVCQVLDTIGLSAAATMQELDEQSLAVIHKIARAHFDVVLEELRAPFGYANHQYPGGGIARMLLIGGGASIAGLAPYLQEGLHIEVATATASDVLESAPHLLAKANHPAAIVALGLAKFTGA